MTSVDSCQKCLVVRVQTNRMPHFTFEELACKHCGHCHVSESFLYALNTLREDYGKPMPVNSCFRCEYHPVELKKDKPGEHSRGAIDVGVSRGEAYDLLSCAMRQGCWRGLGFSQKGGSRFLHLDMRKTPMIWSY